MARAVLAVLMLVTAVTALARPGQQPNEKFPDGAYFRYKTPDGVVHMERTLSNQAIYNGYQLMDPQGRVLENVKAEPYEDAAARARRHAENKARRERQARDEELRRLYAGPEDAARARDRKIQALKLKISYAENNLAQLEKKRDDELALAARQERSGHTVSQVTRDTISRFKRQVAETEKQISQYHDDIKSAQAEYAPIIDRLKQLDAQDKEAD
ncbi:MAG: hypothetical protein R3292_02725 [Alcanivorax sp.]|nr:hypothetical protein [Alcanivorax sp.]